MRIRLHVEEKPQLIAKFNCAIKSLAMSKFFDRMPSKETIRSQETNLTNMNGRLTETSINAAVVTGR